jgi:hypothetical protein
MARMRQHYTGLAGKIGARAWLLRVTPESLNLHFTQFLTPSFVSAASVGARASVVRLQRPAACCLMNLAA